MTVIALGAMVGAEIVGKLKPVKSSPGGYD
jgi:hypothetical protein